MTESMLRLLQVIGDPIVTKSLGILDLVALAAAMLAPRWLNPIAFFASLLVTTLVGVALGRRYWML